MTKKLTWISEEIAADLIGLQGKTLRLYARNGKLPIRYSKVTYKAKTMYVKEDIETLLLMYMQPVKPPAAI